MSTTADEDWRPEALCRKLCARGEIDSELFFPVGTKGPAAEQIEEAKKICRRCPVIRQCGEEAEAFGIWGGTTEDDRRAARRRARTLART